MTAVSMDVIARNRASGTFNAVGDDADRAGDRIARMGGLARTGLAAFATGATVAGLAGYKLAGMASDLNETGSKTEQIFGVDGASALQRWAATADTSLGQSRQLALDGAATFGTFGKAANLAGDDLVAFARDNTELAADLASFHNATPEEAIEALGAAFRGEAEPMRRFGVLLDDATMRNEALKLGLVSTTKEALTPQQKVLAAQALIMRQTADAQGDFERTSGGLANQQRILEANLRNAGTELGQVFLPALTDAVRFANGTAIPAADRLFDAFEQGGFDGLLREVEELTGMDGKLVPAIDAIVAAGEDLGTILTKSVIPALQDGSDVLPAFVTPLKLGADALGFMADHSDLTKVALQGLVVWLGAAKVATLLQNSALATGVTRLQQYRAGTLTASQAVAGMGGVARNAAGAGGMLALVASQEAITAEADKSTMALGALGTVAGATATGFALGGPWGAAAGAVAGLGLASYQVADAHADAEDAAWDQRQAEIAAAQAMRDGRVAAASYSDTLDELTGATTRQTRMRVIAAAQESGNLQLTQRLGVASRDLVGAVLGREGATRRLTRAMQENAASLTGPEQAQLNQWLRSNAGAFATQQDEAIEAARAMRSWRQALRGLPPEVRTRVRQIGADISMAELRQLTRRYDLTPKQVRTIIEAVGTETTIRKVNGVWKVFKDGKPANPNLAPWIAYMENQLERGKRGVRNDVGDINELLGGAGTTRANMDPYVGSIRQGVGQARGLASSGGAGVGAALADGTSAAIRARSASIASSSAAMVRGAIAAAQAAARSRSPSKETEEKVGIPLADGVIAGMEKRQGRANGAAIRFVGSVVDGARRRQGMGLDRLSDQFRAYVDREVAQATKAQDRMQAVAAKYAATRATFAGAQGSIFSAPGLDDAGGVTLMSQMMYATEQRDRAQQVQAAVRTLISRGASDQLLNRLRSEGVGGYEQILALASADRSQISTFNQLEAQTAAAYAGAAGSVNTALYGNEIGRAQRDAREEQRDARQARVYAAALERALRAMPDNVVKVYISGNQLVAAQRERRNDTGRGGRGRNGRDR